MRINIHFNPYGHIGSEPIVDQRSTIPSATDNLSKEIAKNEAIIAALLAIIDQEEKEKKEKKHRFQFLNKKQQAKVLLSNLNNIKFNFCNHVNSTKEKVSDRKQKAFIVCKNKQKLEIGCSAAQAIAQAAEAWIVARNTELLEVAASLFFATTNDETKK